MAGKIKPPSSIFSKVKDYGVPISSSENGGRSGGYYEDEDSESRGYRSVILLIQKGLASCKDQVLEAVRLVLRVQKGIGIKYPIIPCSFGGNEELHHEGKYFDMGYMNDWMDDYKITEVLLHLSGSELDNNTSVINRFYPSADNRSLYNGKTNAKDSDLIVIIGRKDEVVISQELLGKISSSIKKHILFVEINGENTNWYFRNIPIINTSSNSNIIQGA